MSIFTNTGAKGFPKSLQTARKDIDTAAEGLKDGSLIEDDAITTAKIIDDAITTVKILNLNVTADKLSQNSVQTIKIVEGAVNVSKLAANGATANALANSVDYASASVGANTHLAVSTRARTVIIVAEVLEVFANGTGSQPTFEVGIDGGVTALSRFFADTVFTDAALGARFYAGGIINADCELVVTAVAGAGNGTGAIRFSAIAI